MQLSDFDYTLPDELIAQQPASRREASRMLVVNRAGRALIDDQFSSFSRRLDPTDVLVLNNTRVFPARLLGVSDTGAKAEIFLVTRLSHTSWQALAKPARRLKTGKHVTFGETLGGVITRNDGDGNVEIEFDFGGDFYDVLDRVGGTPLPPYIRRDFRSGGASDVERYQTVYAKHRGAIAAPTAGLHFTAAILDEIRAKGVQIIEITLHVGYGTFEPVRDNDVMHHSVLPERYVMNGESAEILNSACSERRRIIAVGTTTTRALESAAANEKVFRAGEGVAGITITPGYRFRAVGAMLTNFHL
ncbi:MAG: tRNA preQ1(34) S-adenosylmethionine ribosyltransferase-isomerase QueA, partial [Blastocatellia bacterium]|nr:tRNA preQ1(34) S-adenosylmethionine ribosyltransferase-isomerase QueA [Blastocatellia bacterium]